LNRTLPAVYVAARPAALRAPDRATGELFNAIKGIDGARRIVQENLSNADTTAYKAVVARCEGRGRLSCYLDLTQGTLEKTGRPLDVGIQGQAFFAVKVLNSIGNGIGYSRNGNFVVNKNGDLVLNIGDGYKLVPPITIPANTTDVFIGIDGTVTVLLAGQTVKFTVGTLQLTQFINPQGLGHQGGSIFTETESSGPPTSYAPGQGGTGQLLQGFLESSNVDKVRESERLRFLEHWRAESLAAAGVRENGETEARTAALQAPDRQTDEVLDAIEGVSEARSDVEYNIKNANTTAFKASRAIFENRGRLGCTQLDLTQGSLESTNRPLDVGIQGQRFFKVKIVNSIGNGLGYSRNGHFVVNKAGELVLDVGDGCKLVPPINIPQNTSHITIGIDGTISVLLAGQTARQQVGSLKLTRFVNPDGLQLQAGSIFTETEASGPPTEYAPGDGGAGQVLQGFLEKSNVDVNVERARLRFLDKWRADLLIAAGVSD